jgi:membrane-associated phospholipid phosphatase
MNAASSYSWGLPSRAKVWLYLRINFLLCALFALVYGGTNWLAAAGGRAFHLYAAWELSIPLVPAAIVIYFSIGLLFWLPLFVFDERALVALAKQFALGTLVAGLIFVLLPASLGYERLPPTGGFQQVFSLLHSIDQKFNTVPSLHVTYSTLIFGALYRIARTFQARLAWMWWWSCICVSVLLVHQHHVVDIFAGVVLGAILLINFCRTANGTKVRVIRS